MLSSQEDAIAQTDQILEAAAQEPQAAELLTQAKEAMEKAADNLYDAVHDRSMTALSNALIHEQTAYQLILKANPKESSVTQGGSGGGGGEVVLSSN